MEGSTLYQNWRQNNPLPGSEAEVLAYDMTVILFHDSLFTQSQLGYKPDTSEENRSIWQYWYQNMTGVRFLIQQILETGHRSQLQRTYFHV